jgi:hypothetical protein
MATREIPPIGTRFEFSGGRGGHSRVYQLISSADPAEGCYRHTLRLVEESGCLPEHSFGVGSEITVEDAWFTERRDAKRLPAGAV